MSKKKPFLFVKRFKKLIYSTPPVHELVEFYCEQQQSATLKALGQILIPRYATVLSSKHLLAMASTRPAPGSVVVTSSTRTEPAVTAGEDSSLSNKHDPTSSVPPLLRTLLKTLFRLTSFEEANAALLGDYAQKLLPWILLGEEHALKLCANVSMGSSMARDLYRHECLKPLTRRILAAGRVVAAAEQVRTRFLQTLFITGIVI